MMNRKLGIVVLGLLGPLSLAQERQAVPGALDPVPGDLAAAQAIDKAAAFYRIVGEPALDRRKVHYWIQRKLDHEEDERVYKLNDGLRTLELDSRTGVVEYYSLSSYALRDQIARSRLPGPESPTRAQAEAIVEATAKAVGLPPGAKLVSLKVRDQNPSRDADVRGYVYARYGGTDGSMLVLVFDRLTGRLENMDRMGPPKRRGDPRRRQGGPSRKGSG